LQCYVETSNGGQKYTKGKRQFKLTGAEKLEQCLVGKTSQRKGKTRQMEKKDKRREQEGSSKG